MTLKKPKNCLKVIKIRLKGNRTWDLCAMQFLNQLVTLWKKAINHWEKVFVLSTVHLGGVFLNLFKFKGHLTFLQKNGACFLECCHSPIHSFTTSLFLFTHYLCFYNLPSLFANLFGLLVYTFFVSSFIKSFAIIV